MCLLITSAASGYNGFVLAIKGTEVISRQEFLERHYGAGTYEAVLKELPVNDREILSPPILGIQLYPAGSVTSLNHAICRIFGEGRESFFRTLGAFSAEQFGEAFFRVNRNKPALFMKNVVEMFRHFYAGGWMEAEFLAENRAVISISLEEPDRCHCLTGEGFYKRCMERCGLRRVQVSQEECQVTGAVACRLEFSWEIPGVQ